MAANKWMKWFVGISSAALFTTLVGVSQQYDQTGDQAAASQAGSNSQGYSQTNQADAGQVQQNRTDQGESPEYTDNSDPGEGNEEWRGGGMGDDDDTYGYDSDSDEGQRFMEQPGQVQGRQGHRLRTRAS